MKRTVIYFCAAIALLAAAAWAGQLLHHHLYFRYLLTDMELPYDLDYSRRPFMLKADPQKILSQPFYYLGQGAQSYAFASADGGYVLKIFHYKHYKNPAKKEKLLANLTGYDLAATYLPEETGILYQQLTPGTGPQSNVTVTDRLGFRHTIELHSVRYVLQKKAAPYQGTQEEREKLIALVEKERSMHLYDRDQGLGHNAGFIEGSPIHYDVGKLTYDPAFCASHEYIQHKMKIEERLSEATRR